MKRKIFCMALILILVYLSSTSCFAARERQIEELSFSEGRISWSDEMWHYSGGYWLLGFEETGQVKITDAQIGSALGITEYLKQGYVSMKAELPSDVKQALAEGAYINFDLYEFTEGASESLDFSTTYGELDDNYIYVNVQPTLPLFGLKSFDDYVTNLSISLPLIDHNFGDNLYSIYKNGDYQGTAQGRFNANETRPTITSPWMHPYMIKNSSGILKTSYKFKLGTSSASYPSNHYVGWGTFKYGGAVGYKFVYSLGVIFTGYKITWVEVPDEEPYIPEDEPEPIEDPSDEGSDIEDDNQTGATDPAAPDKWLIHRVRKTIIEE